MESEQADEGELDEVTLAAGKKQAKVEICHVQPDGTTRTILVIASKVDEHLAHGDTLGACP